MEGQSGRIEKRLPIAVPIWLTSSKNPGPFEKAVTENVSSIGARIIVGGSRHPGEVVVLLCATGCIAQGQVVYACAVRGEKQCFALGIRLSSHPSGWPVELGEVQDGSGRTMAPDGSIGKGRR